MDPWLADTLLILCGTILAECVFYAWYKLARGGE